MTPVLVVCTLDGEPMVYPDGTICVLVPGADAERHLAEHGGQCEVREMALVTARREART